MTPQRRFLALMVLGLLLPLTLPTTRVLLDDIWRREDVQSRLDAGLRVGVQSTTALIDYARAAGQDSVKLLVNGKPVGAGTVDTADNWKLDHGCSLSAGQVEEILKQRGSPAADKGVGEASVKFCDKEKIDNAYWLAMFGHESSYGVADGWAGQKGGGHTTANTGNVICVSGWGGCFGKFADLDDDWVKGTELHFRLLRCYRDGGGSGCEGLWNNGQKHETIVDALNTWAPPSDGNNQNTDCEADPGSYPCAVQADVRSWRGANKTVVPVVVKTGSDSDVRKKIIEYALSRQGDPYVSGARGAGGSDCSGFIQHVYKTITGVDPGFTTYDQFPNLTPIEQADLQNGDLWYGSWAGVSPPNNEHTGIVADVDGDGKWDLIHNGADKSEVHVTSDFLSSYLGEHTMGFRTVLGATK